MKLSNKHKTIFFWTIVFVVVTMTLYLFITTFFTNIHSATKGPVHWHADFEILICGEKQELPEAEFLENKIGTQALHHHNDYRIHVEGTVKELEDVSLDAFFHAIGGDIGETYISLLQEDGTVEHWQNGDYCPNGKKGIVNAFVQQGDSTEWKEIEDIPSYIISPEVDVPPGDRIKIVFE